MVKIRLHGGFFVARLFPFKCCRRFTSFAICLQYPFGAGNRNTLLPRFLVFSGFITVKSQRWVFPFDNMQPLRCNSKRLICFFFFTTKNFCTTSAVYAICATVGCLLCQFGKIAMQMHKNFLCDVCRAIEKNHKFLHNAAVYAIRATVGCFLCQFVKIAMQMRKNFVCNVCSAREKNHKIPLSWRLFA